ncbi:MAG: ABC transporter substrate-binding protein [Deinococcales bacterium]
MKFFTSAIFFSLAVGVAGLAQTAYPVVVKHDAGETRLSSRAGKIVVLGAISLEVALSLGIQPVGYGSVPPYIPENAEIGKPISALPMYSKLIKTMPVLVGSPSDPSLDAIRTLDPDLIVSDSRFAELNTKLDDIAPVLAFNFSSAGVSARALEALATATSRQRQAQEVKRNLERSVNINKPLVQGVVAKGKRMNIFFVTTDALFRGGPMSDTGRQLGSLGFEVVGVSKDSNIDKISLESLPLQRANIAMVLMSAVAPTARKDRIMTLLKKSNITRLVRYDLRPDRLITGPISEPLLLDEFAKLIRAVQ